MDRNTDSGAIALLRMYDNLRSVYIGAHGAPPRGSVLFGLLDMGSKNRRASLLREAALAQAALGSAAEQLVRDGLADRANMSGSVTLSAKGVWQAELMRATVDTSSLIEFIETKWFACFSDLKAALSEKERVILFAMLAVRAFSKETGMDLRREGSHAAWQKAIELSAQFLREVGLVGEGVMTDIEELGAKGTSLRPLQHFLRYTENIKRKTDGVYEASSLNYYLRLSDGGEVTQDSLVYMFELVFGGEVDFSLVSSIAEFCRHQAYDVAATAYSPGEVTFANFEFDKRIEAALRELALNS